MSQIRRSLADYPVSPDDESSLGPADATLWRALFGGSDASLYDTERILQMQRKRALRRAREDVQTPDRDYHAAAAAGDAAKNDDDDDKQTEAAATAVLDFYQKRILRMTAAVTRSPAVQAALPGSNDTDSVRENNAAVIPRTLGTRPIHDSRQGNDWRQFMDIKLPADGSCIGFIIALSWADQAFGYQKGHFGINKASVIPPLAPRPRRWELVACELPSSSSSNGEETNKTTPNALLASLPETPVIPYPPCDRFGPYQPHDSETNRRGGLMLRNFKQHAAVSAFNTHPDDDTITNTQPPERLYRYLPLQYSVGDGGGHMLHIRRCEVVAFRHCLPSRHAVWHWMWHFQQVKQKIEQQRQNQTVVAAPPSNGDNIINLFFKSRIEIDSFTSLVRGISTRLPNEVLIDVCEYIEGPRHGNNSVVEYARHLISKAQFDDEDTSDRPRLYVVDFKDLINPVQHPCRQY